MTSPECSFCGRGDVSVWAPLLSCTAVICRRCAEAAAAAIAVCEPRPASHSDVAQLATAVSELVREMQAARAAAAMAAPPIGALAARSSGG